jgi:hypothetical protein
VPTTLASADIFAVVSRQRRNLCQQHFGRKNGEKQSRIQKHKTLKNFKSDDKKP